MLKITNLSKTYGTGDTATQAIADLSIEVNRGEFVCIVGPSGCGKTTLLKTISGLLPATSGTVELEGKPITAPPEQMALVFQDYSRSLYPWMTVAANVEFPLRRRAKAERRQAVQQALESVGRTASPASTRGSSRAGCSSASRSRAGSRTGPRSC
jgi:NitT/TauT family transport system ATP-binding protein